MTLTHLEIKNFRSIGEIELELSPLTVLVGPNASGKSNILDALQFVRDVFLHGLAAAVDKRQGANHVRCRAHSSPDTDVLEFVLTFAPRSGRRSAEGVRVEHLRYAMSATIPGRGSAAPEIISEVVTTGL